MADEIARAAARLIVDRRASSVREAISIAGRNLGFAPAVWPGPALVRQHAQAIIESMIGESGHRDLTRERQGMAEEIMTLLDTQLAPEGLWLVGRGARGHFDGDSVIRVRFHGHADIGEIAALLVEAGFEEPSFETLESRWGRLSQLRFNNGEVVCVITRCPPTQVLDPALDLVTGHPTRRVDLHALRRTLGLEPEP